MDHLPSSEPEYCPSHHRLYSTIQDAPTLYGEEDEKRRNALSSSADFARLRMLAYCLKLHHLRLFVCLDALKSTRAWPGLTIHLFSSDIKHGRGHEQDGPRVRQPRARQNSWRVSGPKNLSRCLRIRRGSRQNGHHSLDPLGRGGLAGKC